MTRLAGVDTRMAWVKGIAAAGLAFAALLMPGCGQRMALGGDATETGNARVSGQVVMEGGLPVGGAEVTILPSDFNPAGPVAVPDSQKDTTDAEGRYRFTRLRSGSYNLQVRHSGSRTRSILFGIELDIDSIAVPKDTLHATGSMTVPLPETGDSGVGYVYVPGTTYRKRVDSELRIAGFVLVDSLPPGLMPSVVYSKGDSDSRPIEMARDVRVRMSETARVDAYATWSHSGRLAMNTSESGVETTVDQRDFPMLVRLSAPGFDFSAAAPGGADLRFSKPNGMPLDRAIESWDAQSGRAEVWVRIDTVHAGSASQYITMHWGNAGAAEPRKRRSVFDTASGFAGVWHLSEEAADTGTGGLYRDATGAGGDGDDRIADTGRSGVVGAGHGLDSGDYIVAVHPYQPLQRATSYSLAIWYRSDARGTAAGSGDLINVGDNFGMRIRSDSVLHMWYWPPVPAAGSATDWNEVSVKDGAFIDGNWHLACGTFDGSHLRLYLDGIEVGNKTAPEPMGMQFPLNVTMGRHGNGKPDFDYVGDLDEGQVHTVARDPDWIRLSFENQRIGSGFPAPATE